MLRRFTPIARTESPDRRTSYLASYLFHRYAAAPYYFYFVTCFILPFRSPQSSTRC
jgi:hypothetical protein